MPSSLTRSRSGDQVAPLSAELLRKTSAWAVGVQLDHATYTRAASVGSVAIDGAASPERRNLAPGRGSGQRVKPPAAATAGEKVTPPSLDLRTISRSPPPPPQSNQVT